MAELPGIKVEVKVKIALWPADPNVLSLLPDSPLFDTPPLLPPGVPPQFD